MTQQEIQVALARNKFEQIGKLSLDLLKERDLTKLRIERAEADSCWLTPQIWRKMSRKEQVRIVNSGEIQFPENIK